MSITVQQNVGRTTRTAQTTRVAPAERKPSVTQTSQTSQAPQTAGPDARTVRPVPAPPSTRRRMLLTWLAVYPTITLVQLLVGGHIATLPLPARTLIVTGMVVPVMVTFALPQVTKLDRRIATHLAARRG